MRKGLYRKSGELLVVLLSYVIYIGINLPVDIPAFIAGYIVVMELLSVCENLNQAGLPVPTWITKRLNKVAQDLTEEDPIGPIDDSKKDSADKE
jgi:phage-related holin